MDPGLRTSASGMKAQQDRVNVIANNLANVNTTGFKRSRVAFQDVLYDTIQGPAAVNQDGSTTTLPPMQVGRGVRTAGVVRVHSQGAAEMTGRPMDLTLDGDGFFQVRHPSGQVAYTRDGGLQLSDTGAITTLSGYRLEPGFTIPPDAIGPPTISGTGDVLVQVGLGGETIDLGRIEIARFLNPAGLQSLGQNLLVETAASGQPITGFPQDEGFGTILPGMLESSNVEIVQEMVDMISAQRAYEINSKAIRVAEEMTQAASNDILR